MSNEYQTLLSYVQSIDSRVVALREDTQTHNDQLQSALLAQQKEYTATLQDILLTTQEIKSSMVVRAECEKCQDKFITRKEVKTLALVGSVVIGAVTATLDFVVTKAADILQFFQRS